MALTITVESTREIDVIIYGLRKLPMEEAEMLVHGIRMQIIQQLQAQQNETAENSDAASIPSDPA